MDVVPRAAAAATLHRGRQLPRHRTRRPRRAVVVAVVVALLWVVGLGQVLARRAELLWGPSRPGLPADAAAAPLARPAPAPGGRGGYRFLHLQDDGSNRPVRWDPCRPIHYVVNEDAAPPSAEVALADALAEIERVSGLRFVRDGSTSEVPRRDRPTMDPQRYGQRWSPVLVAWTDRGEYPDIGGFAGLAGGDPIGGEAPGTLRYVSGVVLLNREHLTKVAGWQAGAARVRAVILHELAHLMGLDHVDDPHQLMFERPTVLANDLGDGDLRGLAALSRGPCFRDF